MVISTLPLSNAVPTACVPLKGSSTEFVDSRVYFRDDVLAEVFYVRFEGVASSDDLTQKILDGSPDTRTTKSMEYYEFSHTIFELNR